jgi:hypothetical protein
MLTETRRWKIADRRGAAFLHLPGMAGLGRQLQYIVAVVQPFKGPLHPETCPLAYASNSANADTSRVTASSASPRNSRSTTSFLRPADHHLTSAAAPDSPPVALRAPSYEPCAIPPASFIFSISNHFPVTRFYPKFVSRETRAGTPYVQVLAKLMFSKCQTSWKDSLAKLKARGLSGVEFVVCDDHA